MTRSRAKSALALLATVFVGVLAFSGSSPASGIVPVVAFQSYQTFDPATAFSTMTWQTEYATCSQLLSYSDDPAPSWIPPRAGRRDLAADGVRRRAHVHVHDQVGPRLLRRLGRRGRGVLPARAATRRRTQLAGLHLHERDLRRHRRLGDDQRRQRDGEHPDHHTVGARRDVPVEDGDAVLLCRAFLHSLSASTLTPIPSAGPYYVDSGSVTTSSGSITGFHLRRNPNYGGDRPAVIDEIAVTVQPNASTSYAAATAGSPTVDFTSVAVADRSAADSGYGPASAAAAAGHQQYFTPSSNGVQYVVAQHRPDHRRPRPPGDRPRHEPDTARRRPRGETDRRSRLVEPSGLPGLESVRPLGDVPAAQALMQDAGYGLGTHLALKLITQGSAAQQAFGNHLTSELQSIYIDVTYDHSLARATTSRRWARRPRTGTSRRSAGSRITQTWTACSDRCWTAGRSPGAPSAPTTRTGTMPRRIPISTMPTA